jgi:predicted DNA-binding transcriptional regulator AlpA
MPQRTNNVKKEKDYRDVDYVRTRQETAAMMGISVKTLTRMESRGDAPARMQITERIVGYRQSAIDQFLNSKAIE